jgi:hypothetical protein
VRCLSGNRKESVKIEVLLSRLGCFFDRVIGPGMLGRGDKPHMSFRKGLSFDLGYGPQDRKGAVLFDSLLEDRFVAGACHPVQDNAANVDLRVKLHTA